MPKGKFENKIENKKPIIKCVGFCCATEKYPNTNIVEMRCKFGGSQEPFFSKSIEKDERLNLTVEFSSSCTKAQDVMGMFIQYKPGVFFTETSNVNDFTSKITFMGIKGEHANAILRFIGDIFMPIAIKPLEVIPIISEIIVPKE